MKIDAFSRKTKRKLKCGWMCVQVLVCEYVQGRETERERGREHSMCIPAASQVLGRVQGRLSAGTVLSRVSLSLLSRRPI